MSWSIDILWIVIVTLLPCPSSWKVAGGESHISVQLWGLGGGEQVAVRIFMVDIRAKRLVRVAQFKFKGIDVMGRNHFRGVAFLRVVPAFLQFAI